MKRLQRGFSLVELSVALLALGIVLLGAVVLWQLSERQRVSTRQMDTQVQVREAVIGFVHANFRMPCPALDTLGTENCGAGQVGYVPWRTLGLPRPEAGQLRYGVYRQASTTAHEDRDLAVLKDRMNPLRVATPSPRPQNNTAPNGQLPPLPVASAANLLGATQSGSFSDPLSGSCDASNGPPCPATPVGSATNLIDVCLALNTASDNIVAPAGNLGVNARGSRQAVAFVIAAPGMLNASGTGNRFDGANGTATNASPTFESPSTLITNNYDDQVISVSHSELFSQLHCGAALSAAMHAHFNAATSAFVLERALYDYRDQLYVAWKLADADVYAAAAGVASAASAILDAAKEMVSATADTTMSAGARSFQIGLAAAGIATAALAAAAAGYAQYDAIASRDEAWDVWEDFATRTTAATDLSISINRNALIGDAIGY